MNSTPVIKATAIIHNSKRDIYGNCYWAFTYTDHATGKVVQGTGACESNIKSGLRQLHPDNGILIHDDEMKIREFNRFTKGFKYAGCVGSDVARWINLQLSAS